MRHNPHKSLLQIALALLTGFLLYLSFSKLQLWFTAVPALLLLLHTRQGTFWLLSGFVFFFLSLQCASISAVEFGGLSPVLFYLFFSVFALLLSLYQFYAPLELWRAFFRKLPLALPLLFVFFELVRSHFPYGGFPWLILGTLSVYIPVVKDSMLYLNVYWHSLLLLWSAQLLLYRKFRWLIGLWAVFALSGLFALWEKGERLQKAEKVKVALVQTAVPQEDKLSREAFKSHAPYLLNLVEQAVGLGVDLVVLPESALHFFYSEEEDSYNIRLRELSLHTPILVGLIDLRGGMRPYNSAYLLKGGMEVGHYDKVKLFPIGEYMPWPFGFLKELLPVIGGIDYVPGERLEPMTYGKIRIATPICFEVAYHSLVKKLSEGANLIAVLTNDGWFKNSDCTHQHYLWARVRALENGKYVLWVNNSGDTGVIDLYGRVLTRMPYMKRGIGLYEIPLVP